MAAGGSEDGSEAGAGERGLQVEVIEGGLAETSGVSGGEETSGISGGIPRTTGAIGRGIALITTGVPASIAAGAGRRIGSGMATAGAGCAGEGEGIEVADSVTESGLMASVA
jgi:hypothetical protein